MDGCTSCGNKSGCSHRKGEMFAAIDQALNRLYPSQCWNERRDPPGAGWSVGSAVTRLTDRLADRLSALCVYLPGSALEYCSYVYVLCTGRSPALIELREGLCRVPEDGPWPGRGALEADPSGWQELYLRVALSSLAPFAAVQQVTMRAEIRGGLLLCEEATRSGVFDPPLLPRFRKLVAVLADLGIRHLDCGDIAEPPAGFDPGDYRERYGELPSIINYLFYPQPADNVTSTVIRLSPPRTTISRVTPALPDRPGASIE